jgi:phage RecT family recombinase
MTRTENRRNAPAPENTETAVITVTPKEKAAKIEDVIRGRRGQILDLVGGDPKIVDRFITVALSSIVKSNDLLDADPLSLLNAVRDAAMMGLEPAGPLGEGAIVARWDRDQGKKIAQFQPMFRGLRKLAMQHPDVTVVNAGIRHEKDGFEYREGSDPFIRHEPYIDDDDPGAVMGAYAYAKLRGELVVLYMNTAQIRKRRAVARTDSIWKAWEEEMMLKTVTSRLIRSKLPMTLAMGQATSVDEADLEAPTVTTPERAAIGAPGSRTRARLGAGDDVGDDAPVGPQDAPRGGEGGEVESEGTKAEEGTARAVCVAESEEFGACIREPHGDNVNHRNADGETWAKTPGDSSDG